MIYILLLMIAQVIIEVFPVSSSGHMELVKLAWLTYASTPIPPIPAFFDHLLHGPMILILMIFFRHRWYPFLSHVISTLMRLTAPVTVDDAPLSPAVRMLDVQLVRQFFHLVGTIILADGVTAIIYGIVKLLERRGVVVATPEALCCGFTMTFLLLVLLKFKESRASSASQRAELVTPTQLSIVQIMMLGFAQGIVLFPGISRFASVYVLGSYMGLPPKIALEYSFLLFFPLMVVAFFINGLSGLFRQGVGSLMGVPAFWVGITVATIIAYGLFCLVYRMALARKLWYCAVYVLCVPIAFLLIHLFFVW